MSFFKITSFIFISVLLFSGCSQKIEQLSSISKSNLQKIDMNELDGFNTDDLSISLDVFLKDCQARKQNSKLLKVCAEAKKETSKNDPKNFFLKNFTAYQLLSDDESKEGLITGYYEPLLQGSLHKTKRFKYPVYALPKNLYTIDMSSAYKSLSNYRLRGKIKGNKIVPYDTRKEIEKSNYEKNPNLNPICFVDNKIDLFFLQIQGSGKVQLENGKIINIGYAGQNGRPYYSIGRKLIQIGAIEKKDVSLQTIRKWLVENPSKVDEILHLNQSYVFFTKKAKTATGSLGTELTANRNLAVDRKSIPLGFPVFIKTTNPLTSKPINQLMVAADTGGAIKGKIRADFFFGNGEKAQDLAGKMKQKGELFIFVPNNQIEKKD